MGSVISILNLGAFVGRRLGPLDLRVGPGVYFYMISGQGGSVVLDNGNSTSEFYSPGFTSTARMFYLSAGTGLELGAFRLDADAVFLNTFSRLRTISGYLTFSYGFL
jgi:hypothetical protein